MGKYMLFRGEYRPSDSWLEEHEDIYYELGDEEDDRYDVADDEEALEEEHTCQRCSDTFTIAEAFRIVEGAFPTHLGYSPDLTYESICTGELCGECAVEAYREDNDY